MRIKSNHVSSSHEEHSSVDQRPWIFHAHEMYHSGERCNHVTLLRDISFLKHKIWLAPLCKLCCTIFCAPVPHGTNTTVPSAFLSWQSTLPQQHLVWDKVGLPEFWPPTFVVVGCVVHFVETDFIPANPSLLEA